MDELESAVHYMKRMYERITKIRPVIIARNGTVYYCFIETWATEPEHLELLSSLAYKATTFYPDEAMSIVDRLIDELPFDEGSSPSICWAIGYFQRIMDEGIDYE